LLDIFKRLKWELDGSTHNESPDLAVYWDHPHHREILTDMESRKATIDDAIRQITAARAEKKSEMEQKLKDVADMLEAEKRARAKEEGERKEAEKELEKRTAALKGMELEEEARELMVKQLGQQLSSCGVFCFLLSSLSSLLAVLISLSFF
jgi:hypothetical protein